MDRGLDQACRDVQSLDRPRRHCRYGPTLFQAEIGSETIKKKARFSYGLFGRWVEVVSVAATAVVLDAVTFPCLVKPLRYET